MSNDWFSYRGKLFIYVLLLTHSQKKCTSGNGFQSNSLRVNVTLMDVLLSDSFSILVFTHKKQIDAFSRDRDKYQLRLYRFSVYVAISFQINI